ncbi:MAG: GAF domain-containing protein [Gemmatimonadota bacterium]
MSESDAAHESARLAALRSYDILDTPPDGAFDRVTALAARIFNTPIALVSLVDEDRIWFKSRYGLDTDEIPRDPGLCASVIFSPDTYVVRDALSDPRALANPLVAGAFGLRFYAAAPLVTHDGHRLGTLNVMDFEPRDFTEDDERILAELAGAVMDQMELRISSRKAVQSLSSLIRHAREQDEGGEIDTKGLTTICSWTSSILVDGAWMTFEEFLETQLGLKITHGMRPDEAARILEQAD